MPDQQRRKGIVLVHGAADGGFVVVSAAGGIEGTPTFVCDKTNWQLKVSEDRKSLCAIYRPTGTSIVIR